MKTFTPRITLLLLLAAGNTVSAGDTPGSTLDALHRAGAAADHNAFAAELTTDTMLLGLAGDQRWEGPDVDEALQRYFSGGGTWTFQAQEREIKLSPGGTLAWFSESLADSGSTDGWGSGVLVKTDSGWRVAQYHLTPPVATIAESTAIAPTAVTATPAGDTGATGIQEESLTTGSSSAVQPAAEPTAEEPEKKKCRKKRHKTNWASNC